MSSDGERIEQIKARAEAATPGPWEVYPGAAQMVLHPCEDHGYDEVAQISDSEGDNDADFIAAARDDVGWLLDRLTEAEKRLAAAQGVLDDSGPFRAGDGVMSFAAPSWHDLKAALSGAPSSTSEETT